MKNLSILSMALLLPLAAACSAPGAGSARGEAALPSATQVSGTSDWLLGCDISASPAGAAKAQPLNWIHFEYAPHSGGDKVVLTLTGGTNETEEHTFNIGYMHPDVAPADWFCRPITLDADGAAVQVEVTGFAAGTPKFVAGAYQKSLHLESAPSRPKAIVRAVSLAEDVAQLVITYKNKTVTLYVWS